MVNKIDNTSLLPNLSGFGLSEIEQKIYIHLLRRGALTPLIISRETGINRSTLYRVLESLSQKSFVSETLAHKSRTYEATNPSQLSLIVTQKQSEIDTLKDQLPAITKQLSSITSSNDPSTRIYYFKGQSGLRQLLYNTLQSTTEVLGYGFGNWNDGVGKQFAEKLRQEYVDRNMRSREILNGLNSNGSFTTVSGYFNAAYHYRIIENAVLPITHNTIIYNDVISFYHMANSELFGVEIHNASIATTERHIFDLLWKLAKPLRIK